MHSCGRSPGTRQEISRASLKPSLSVFSRRNPAGPPDCSTGRKLRILSEFLTQSDMRIAIRMKESNRPIEIGIIGCGARIRRVVQLLLLAADGKIRVRAVCDPDPVARDLASQAFGGPVEFCESEEVLLTLPAISWVFVGSVNSQHCRHILAAVRHGKHVFAEKPLATSLADALDIRDGVTASDRIFALGLVLRYSRFYQKIKEILCSGGLGQIISFEFNETLAFNHGGFIFGNWRRSRELSGGHMLEKCCHDIDLANWLIDSLPVRVASFGGLDFFNAANAHRVGEIGPNKDGLPAYQGWRSYSRNLIDPFTGRADIYDNQVAILQYANGVRATFHTNCNSAIPERRMYIHGAKGTLRADLTAGILETAQIGWNESIQKVPFGDMDGHGGGDEWMSRALCKTILEGDPPLASVREGICSAIPALAMDQSVSEGRIIDLLPVWEKAGIQTL